MPNRYYGCTRLQRRFTCGHIEPYGTYVCKGHEAKRNWEECPNLGTVVNKIEDRDCDSCAAKARGAAKAFKLNNARAWLRWR
jgi:hypothetical protein